MAGDEDVTLGELARAISRIEGKLDERLGEHDKQLRDLVRENADLREKFATLRGWLVGALAAGGIGGLSGLAALLGGG